MDPELKIQLERLFALARFSSFLESIVENSEIHAFLERPIRMIVALDSQDFHPWEWLDYADGSSAASFPLISREHVEWLDDFSSEEWFVILRWLLDKIVREFGDAARKKGKKSAYELSTWIIHKLEGYLADPLMGELLESYLSLAGDHKLAADLCHALFGYSFSQDEPRVEALYYAHLGLERARKSGDKDRIAWGWYNLVHYHSFFDVDTAESLLDESIDFLQDERYFDLLGNIALSRKEMGFHDRAETYLDSVVEYLRKSDESGELMNLDSMAFNLIFFAENLAWHYFDQNRFREAAELLKYLGRLMIERQKDFLQLAEDLGGGAVDWHHQYYSYRTEAYLWSYACYDRLGWMEEKDTLAADFLVFIARCPYEMNQAIEEFFSEMHLDFPQSSTD